MLPTPKDRAVLTEQPAPKTDTSGIDDLAFALVRRHVAAELRGESDHAVTVVRLRRVSQLWKAGMAGALRHELAAGR